MFKEVINNTKKNQANPKAGSKKMKEKVGIDLERFPKLAAYLATIESNKKE